MKTPHPSILVTLLGVASLTTASAEIKQAGQHSAKAETSVTSENNGSSSSVKKTVTVTSDGKQTIRKTVTIRDGKEEVVTEITDALGKVIRRHGDDDEPGKSDAGDSVPPGEDNTEGGPWLGVRVESASSALRDQLGLEKDQGVVVALIAPDSPATKAEIRVNDILLSLDDKKLSTPSDLRSEIYKRKVGDTIRLKVLRKGQNSDVSVTLEGKKDNKADATDKPAKPDRKGGKGGVDNEVHIEIDGDGAHASATATAEGSAESSFDDILGDPNVPENFKKTVREMKDRMREFEDKHGIKGGKGQDQRGDKNQVD